jgi:Tfp pilus assembly protein PilF
MPKLAHRRRWLAIMVALMACAPCLAQQPAGAIIGTVRVAKGFFPSHNIMVTLSTRGATISTVYTDDEGRFGFSDLVGNLYHVEINDDDFQPVSEAVSIQPDIAPTKILTIYLTPRPGKTTEPKPGSNPYLTSTAEGKPYPKDAVAEFQRGVADEKDGKPDKAQQHYEKALKISPEYYPAQNNLGSLLLAKGDFAQAGAHFDEAMRLNPADAAAFFNRGNLLLLTKQYPAAEQVIRQGLEKQPDSPFGNFVLGSVLVRTGRDREAEGTLLEAVKLGLGMAKARLELVNLYLRQSRKQDAIAQLQQFLQAAPDDPLAPKAKQVLTKLQAEQKTR